MQCLKCIRKLWPASGRPMCRFITRHAGLGDAHRLVAMLLLVSCKASGAGGSPVTVSRLVHRETARPLPRQHSRPPEAGADLLAECLGDGVMGQRPVRQACAASRNVVLRGSRWAARGRADLSRAASADLGRAAVTQGSMSRGCASRLGPLFGALACSACPTGFRRTSQCSKERAEPACAAQTSSRQRL